MAAAADLASAAGQGAPRPCSASTDRGDDATAADEHRSREKRWEQGFGRHGGNLHFARAAESPAGYG
jgi:hypothetical protein